MGLNPMLGSKRQSWQGPNALSGLKIALENTDPNRVVLLTSPSFSDEHKSLIESAAAQKLQQLMVPRVLTKTNTAQMESDCSGFQTVIAIGGGNVMDGAKSLLGSQKHRLIMIPTTLSGSEHSANTTYWSEGKKVILSVGYADMVIADPQLLIKNQAVLRAGAIHSLAHILATAKTENLSEWHLRISAMAAKDLTEALKASDFLSFWNRTRLFRGAWNAAVSFMMSGPKIGAHHLIVHKLAGPSDHATFSATLLSRALTQTDNYQKPIAGLSRYFPEISAELVELSMNWLSTSSALTPLINPSEIEGPQAIQSEITELCRLI
jgi:alcohol dehydrogenase class IV